MRQRTTEQLEIPDRSLTVRAVDARDTAMMIQGEAIVARLEASRLVAECRALREAAAVLRGC